MPRQKTIYRETYVRGEARISKGFLPDLKHRGGEQNKRFVATDAELLAAGVVEEADGTRREYQDIRIYVELEK